MARHDQRDGVVAERRAHGADRPWPADLRGDPAVRPDLAPRDLERLAPDVLLERAVAAQVEVDPDAAIAAEPPRDRVGQAWRQGLGPEGVAPRDRPMAGLERGVVHGRVDDRHSAPVPGHGQRPDRRIDAGVGVGQADLDEDGGSEGRGRRHGRGRPAPPPRPCRRRADRASGSCGHLLELVTGVRLEHRS